MKGLGRIRNRGRRHVPRQSPPQEALVPTAWRHNGSVEGGHLPRTRGITRLVRHSVSCADHGRAVARALFARVEGFAMWRFPRAALAWLLLTDLAVLCWAAWAALRSPVGWLDTIGFAVLTACATAHMVATRKPEERSFGQQPRGHVDQSSIWCFTAGLTLPVSLLLLLVVILRVQRYLIARKPAFRFIFSSAAIIASALGVHVAADAMGVRPWLIGEQPLPHRLDSQTTLLLGGLAVAVAIYFLVQAIIIGIANGVTDTAEARIRAAKPSTPSSAPQDGHANARIWTLENLVGDWATNKFILTTLAVAVSATVAQAVSLPLLVVFVPIAVRFTRIEQTLKVLRAQMREDNLGLLARSEFDAIASLELLALVRAEQSAALLFVDIDHFKSWNTRLGHYGGDQVLLVVPQVIRSQVRAGDLVCRWGGEEFVMLLPNTTRDEALAIAERIRVGFATMDLRVRKAAGGSPLVINKRRKEGEGFTLSIGVAMAPEHGTELEDIAEMADQALEYSKQNGRNQVTFAPTATETAATPEPAVAR